jgi:hypothetical protein
MDRLVDATSFHVVSKGLCQQSRQFHLACFIKGSCQAFGLWTRQNRLSEGHEARAQGTKHSLQVCCLGAGFIVIQQGIVDVAAHGERLALFLAQGDDLFQDGGEGGKIVICARFGPDHMRAADQSRQICSQPFRDTYGAAVAARYMAQLRLGHRGQIILCYCVQPIGDARIGAPLVQYRFHSGAFIPALFCRAARHHRFLIPAQPACHLRQRFCVALECHQLFISTHSGCPSYTLWCGIPSGEPRPQNQGPKRNRAQLMHNRNLPRR